MSTTAKGFASYSIIDVVDGMIWKGDLSSHPSNPERSWAYYNTTDKKSYLYDGSQWVVFVKDGVAGNSVTGVINYYYAHTSDSATGLPAVGDSKWKTKVSDLNPAYSVTNKFLWNYEYISYSSATATVTEPSLIGTYSKDGVSISKVEEYYLVNASSSKPTTLPTVSNDNGWTKGSSSTLPQTTKDKPYLWNYQIVSYSDNSVTSSGPLCVGTYGNSIKQTIEYYAATSTNDAPDRYSSGTTVNTSVWKTSIAECGQSETKPYVWNFERIVYTLDGNKDTEISLLTRSPRGIETITEYYQVKSDGTTPAAPSFRDTDTDHNNPPVVQTAWITNRPSLAQGDTLWNCEIIKYGAVDTDGKNLYTITPPATVAYAGVDGEDGKDGTSPYFISLSDNFIPVPAKANYDVDLPANGYEITPTIKYGVNTITNWNVAQIVPNSSTAAGLHLFAESTSGISFYWSSKDLIFNGMTDGDSVKKGSITFKLYYKETANSTAKIVAEQTCEIVKTPAGSDSVTLSFVADVDKFKKEKTTYSPSSTNITIYKRVGTGAPYIDKDTTYHYQIFADTDETTAKKTDSTANGVIAVDNYGASIRVIVAIYKNNTYTADNLLERVTIGVIKDGEDGAPGEDGGSLKASVDRSGFTEDQWNQHGEIGRVEYWSNTSNSGLKDGDVFIVVGKATDTGKGHQIVFSYIGDNPHEPNLYGTCIAHHIISESGDDAVDYDLIISPASWNSSEKEEETVTFKVNKIVGPTTTPLTSGYTIKYDGNSYNNATSAKVKKTTNFELYVSGTIFDNETITLVQNGAQGIQGPQGIQGVPGKNGENGLTSYLHIAYATSANGKTGFSTTSSTNKTYIGQYTDHTADDSTDPTKYKWTKIKGEQGPNGETFYTWIKYADDASGSNMSDNSTGKTYIGIAYNKSTQTESSKASDYAWSKFKGEDGPMGPKPPVTSTVTAYISQSDYSSSVSTPTGSSLSDGWTLTKPPCDSSNPFIYRCEVTQTVTYSSNTDPTGTTEYGPWGTPELIEAFVGGSAVDPVAYATFVKLTNNETECGLVNQNGTVMINANYIRTGVLKVGPAGSELLNADMANGTLALNGWDVTAVYGMRSADGKVGIASPSNSSTGLYKLSLVSPAYYSKMTFYANDTEVTVSGSINSTIPNFCILADGSLYAKYAKIEGTITTNLLTATGGTIGGWKISDSSLTNNKEIGTNGSFGLYPSGQMYYGTVAGVTNTFTWLLLIGTKFGVTHNGFLYAEGAHISGEITADEGSIGGWEIGDGYLYSGGCYLYSKDQDIAESINGVSKSDWRIRANSNFGVDSGGNVYCTSAKLGDYTFSIENGIVFDNYDVDVARNAALTMRDWQMGGNYFYGIRLQTPEGVNVASGNFDSVGYSAIHSAQAFTFYRGGNGGDFVGANTTNVRSLAIEAHWGSGSSSTNDYIKLPNTMIGTTSSYNIFIDSDQFQFKYGSTIVGELESYTNYIDIQGTFKTNGNNWISSSDAKVKKEIASPTTEYEVLFDNLNPRTYKFINGTSDRTHSGFIVQEVLEAIKQAGLSSQSFAAVCAFGDPNNENTEWGFRYEEVISLNTWQIQKLKPRMTAAEQEILELKQEVRRLSAELENLKNS